MFSCSFYLKMVTQIRFSGHKYKQVLADFPPRQSALKLFYNYISTIKMNFKITNTPFQLLNILVFMYIIEYIKF